MRVALVSNLHGNEVALRAVLDDARALDVDRIVCLGDVATLGPRPREVLTLLRELGCDCILGNHDQFLVEPALIHSYTELAIIVDAVDWCRRQLTDEDLAFVQRFVADRTIDLGDGATLFAYHGSPRSNMEDILSTTPADALDAMLDGRRATVMAGGHTHLQMVRQHRGTLVVNPGSVGLPFREYASGRPPTLMPHAEYATVESRGGAVAVTLRRVAVDRARLRADVAASDYPLRDYVLAQYQGT